MGVVLRNAGVYFSVILLTSLVACGGGGGSSSPPTPPSPSLSVSPNSLTATADAGTSSTPTTSFTVTVSNAGTAGVYVGAQFTKSGIANLSFVSTSSTTLANTVYFQDPSVIGPGVYSDTIRVGLCTDSTCTALKAGTSQDVAVRYTVTGVKPPPATIIASSNTVSVQSTTFSTTPPTATVNFVLANIPSTGGVSFTATSTTIGLTNAMPFIGNTTTGAAQMTLYFKAANTLSPGTYDDVVTVTACLYSNCPTPLSGAPITINTHYVISNTVTGPNGYTVRLVTITANDVAWDAVSGKLYLSIPSTAPSNGNSIVALDPVTGTIGATAIAGSEPNTLSISDNGQYLYTALKGAGSVQRLTLPGLTANFTIPMGSDANGQLFASDVKVAPGIAGTLAVTVYHTSSPGFGLGVKVYDGATARANTATPNSVGGLQWNGVNTLYAFDQYSSANLYTFAVTASGVTLSSTTPTSATNNGRIHLDAGSLYTDGGQQINPASGALTGTYAAPMLGTYSTSMQAALPDSPNNHVYGLIVDYSGGGYFLESYNQTTFTPIASIPLYGFTATFSGFGTPKMVRFGTDGLAVLALDGHLALINGAFVKP